ncbi:Uncharacterized protein dnm_087790 [Desulfonema magnum]|uniref:Uncharacterized protein n=1 Tax=Desulfonema magnum TaxID=45655 RepID=A0A975BVU3_9BACT|nr:Uncharacterized protein dnm_087790 [Desulfonema magnum]
MKDIFCSYKSFLARCVPNVFCLIHFFAGRGYHGPHTHIIFSVLSRALYFFKLLLQNVIYYNQHCLAADFSANPAPIYTK